jgi:hypothetical protein
MSEDVLYSFTAVPPDLKVVTIAASETFGARGKLVSKCEQRTKVIIRPGFRPQMR